MKRLVFARLLLASAIISIGMMGVAAIPAAALSPTSVSTSLSDGVNTGKHLTEPANTPVVDSAAFTQGTGVGAGGLVTYNVYSDPGCTVPAAPPDTVPITVAGTLPDSAPVSLPGLGTYYWQVMYSGDPNNAPSQSGCGSETENVIVGAPTTSFSLPAHKVITQGASDTDMVKVVGNATSGPPTGTVSFTLCGPLVKAAPPTPCLGGSDMKSPPVPLVPETGTTSAAVSMPFTPLSPGWWCFDNTYSGDANYYSSSDNSPNECILVRGLKGSTDYAGFALIQKAAASSPPASSSSSAATTFIVPTEACTSASTGIILGTGIFSSVSNWVSAGGIVVSCVGGAPVYAAQAIVNNNLTNLSLVPVPGDTVTTSVAIVPGSTTVVVDDVTQGSSSTTSLPVGSIGTYISVGTDGDGDPNPLPVPTVGALNFSNSSIDGLTLKAAHAVAVSRVDNGVLQIFTAKLNKAGTGFGQTQEPAGSVTPAMTTTPASASIVLGNAATDTAAVTGNAATGSPTGTVSFYECGPTSAAQPCTSRTNSVGGSQGVVAGPGDTATATSPSFTPTAPGFWCFAGYYSGDGNYAVASDTSVDECFDVTPAALHITTSPPLPSAQIGVSYSVTLQAAGGTAPYKWKKTSGSLPQGLKLKKKTGTISGTPSPTAVTSTFTVRVTDKSHPKQTATESFTITVS